MKNKTLAVWLTLFLGPTGLHRVYLLGKYDGISTALLVPSVIGVYGVTRARELGVNDQVSWLLIPFVGFAMSACALTAIVYGLMDTEQWNLGFDFSEEPIESHPKLKEIKAAFGGYYEEPGGPLKFPEFMPKDSKGKGGLGGKGKAKAGEKNPLFGTSTYAVMTARVTRTWSSKTIPKNTINDIGKVYSSIPDAPDAIAQVDFGSRTWMAMPPNASSMTL